MREYAAMGRAKPTPLLLFALGTALAAVGVAVWLLFARGTDEPPRRPRVKRVLLVTIDTLRADALPLHGNRNVAAPTLSALAADGVIFERAFAPSPWTRPSVASLLTGLPPSVHGFVRRHGQPSLSGGVRTIAEAFSDAGHRTGAIGYNPFLANTTHLRRGFRDFDFHPRADGPSMPDEPDTTAMIAASASAWLDAHASDPFFLWVHFYDPHMPYAPPRRHFRPSPGVRAFRHYDGYVRRVNKALSAAMKHSQDDEKDPALIDSVPPHDRRLIRDLYEGDVRYVDEALGQLVERLRAKGILDETLIVVTSDHGEELFEHGGFEHGHAVHRELLHVPLIVRPASTADASDRSSFAGRRVAGPVTLMNVMPTILALAGLRPNAAQTHWPSLASCVLDGAPAPPLEQFVAGHCLWGREERALVFGDVKYVWRDDDTESLFDLQDDPGETRDIADQSPTVLSDARERLRAYDVWAAALRERLALKRSDGETALSPAERDLLKKHGYIR